MAQLFLRVHPYGTAIFKSVSLALVETVVFRKGKETGQHCSGQLKNKKILQNIIIVINNHFQTLSYALERFDVMGNLIL